MIERVTEAETVEVGRYYMVPCAHVTDGGVDGPWGVIPVTGPRHSDVEIGVWQDHYHYDLRFMSKRNLSRITKRYIRLGPGVAPFIVLHATHVDSIEWHKVKCRREAMPWPWQRAPWMAELENAYAGHRIKPDCRICPHRGIPLNGQPERDGVTVCPGHGLAWNLATGALVRRASKVQP